jgi:hypothetical protein
MFSEQHRNAQPINEYIRLEPKCLNETNTLAYYSKAEVKTVKKFQGTCLALSKLHYCRTQLKLFFSTNLSMVL